MARDSGTKPVVLLVDDEPRILSALERMLRREGYRIEKAGSAAEALERLESEPVDVVVSDHKMPGTTGISLLATVAKRWPLAGRILLTGWSQEIPATQIEAARLDALLAKPWDDEALKRAIAESCTS